MTCMHCNEPDTIKKVLIDGTECCYCCPEWRAECEARGVLDYPTLAERRAYLYGNWEYVFIHGRWVEKCVRKGIKQLRGDAALKEFEELILRVWKARQKQKLITKEDV